MHLEEAADDRLAALEARMVAAEADLSSANSQIRAHEMEKATLIKRLAIAETQIRELITTIAQVKENAPGLFIAKKKPHKKLRPEPPPPSKPQVIKTSDPPMAQEQSLPYSDPSPFRLMDLPPELLETVLAHCDLSKLVHTVQLVSRALHHIISRSVPLWLALYRGRFLAAPGPEAEPTVEWLRGRIAQAQTMQWGTWQVTHTSSWGLFFINRVQPNGAHFLLLNEPRCPPRIVMETSGSIFCMGPAGYWMGKGTLAGRPSPVGGKGHSSDHPVAEMHQLSASFRWGPFGLHPNGEDLVIRADGHPVGLQMRRNSNGWMDLVRVAPTDPVEVPAKGVKGRVWTANAGMPLSSESYPCLGAPGEDAGTEERAIWEATRTPALPPSVPLALPAPSAPLALPASAPTPDGRADAVHPPAKDAEDAEEEEEVVA
ncbi:hypothetical protein PAPYR_908 [Paratrimastix pyriformis]|uniref:F-box domain-containing protein n=1 Tax=Paratrimastix pyriformis TaxID=342808 RepID=A0ABQ8UW17_9EUKA|nr:hypothetical protein PAPYR_908 [Paratrimastix pyriformis]